MTIEIRPTQPGEQLAASDVTGIALMFPAATDEEWAESETGWVESASVTAWDGDRCVGNARAFRGRYDGAGPHTPPDERGHERRRPADVHAARAAVGDDGTPLTATARTDGRVLTRLRRARQSSIAGSASASPVRQHRSAIRRARRDRCTVRTAGPCGCYAEGRDHRHPARPLQPLPHTSRVGVRCARPRWYIDRGLEDVMGGTKPTFVAVHV